MSDLIDRQAVLGELKDLYIKNPTCNPDYGWDAAIDTITDKVKDLPPAQHERKKGKWKINKDGNWACPFCEFDPYHDNMKGMNYCPNCGADMRGKENG